MKNKVIILYVLVPHEGYLSFFRKHEGPILLIDPSEFPELKDQKIFMDRHLSAIQPSEVELMLKSVMPERNISILKRKEIRMYIDAFDEFIFPNEDISHHVSTFFPPGQILFDTIFLRVDKKNLNKFRNVEVEGEEIDDEALSALMQQAHGESQKSGDFWRQVGCICITADGQLLTAHNHHLPNDQISYVKGDPRSCYDAGEHIHITNAMHAEASLIASAAKSKNVSLEGATLFTTTYPCPLCAKYIAESGITFVYYQDPYSLIDAQRILEAAGVQLLRLKVKNPIS
ncbi:MAG: hypothetical protein KA028_03035 [Candidatus Pacebacteria bacterium]|nr:hypothetical protein [Candidatus Paceibacterota bacterium]MBP9851651.1 hypothetical protein [Candidatus Paceibacterota bacterium]